MNLTLRWAALAATATLFLSVTGCASGPARQDRATAGSTGSVEADAFPATVRHAYGSTTVTSAPERVVTVGWSDQDDALALGVVPVGAVKISWGGNEGGSTPWFDAALAKADGTEPVRFDDSDGIPFDDIAKLSPDLILATSQGMSRADYVRLSKIAPVVPHKKLPWGTSWEDSLEMVGAALGRPEQAERLEESTEDQIDAFQDENPQLRDKTFVFATFDPKDTSQVGYYTPLDNRPQMLEQIGLENAALVKRLTEGSSEFWKQVSAERADTLDSDVLVSYGDVKADRAKVLDNPLFSRIPAIRSGAYYFLPDRGDSLSMSLPSPIAMPWFLSRVAPGIAGAARTAERAQ